MAQLAHGVYPQLQQASPDLLPTTLPRNTEEGYAFDDVPLETVFVGAISPVHPSYAPGSLGDRAVEQISSWNATIEEKILRISFFVKLETYQDKLDKKGLLIQEKFSELTSFIQLKLEKNDAEFFWMFLVKLAPRAAYNICVTLTQIITNAALFCVHPLETTTRLAICIVELTYQLIEPDYCAQLGAAMIGSSLGTSLVSGYPLSVVGIIVGTVLLTEGLVMGSIIAAIHEKDHKLAAAWKQFDLQGRHALQAFANGGLMGLFLGGIHRAMQPTYKITNLSEANSFAHKFVKDHGLPDLSELRVDYTTGTIKLSWDSWLNKEAMLQLKPKFLSLFTHHSSHATITLKPGGFGQISVYSNGIPFTMKLSGNLYPMGPDASRLLSQAGPVAVAPFAVELSNSRPKQESDNELP